MRACALNPGLKTLEIEDLQPQPSLSPAGIDPSSARIVIPEDGVDFEEIERAYLSAPWELSGGNQSRGARLLGFKRQAFIYRLQKFGIVTGYEKRGQDED